eukprot:GHVT01015601.1.p1 GENE.GHVT01015601.1~~GHVT01015601.1.p1  ORF type:complete len:175 (-),score=28.33 GHVT01015601.1:353-877(-)
MRSSRTATYCTRGSSGQAATGWSSVDVFGLPCGCVGPSPIEVSAAALRGSAPVVCAGVPTLVAEGSEEEATGRPLDSPAAVFSGASGRSMILPRIFSETQAAVVAGASHDVGGRGANSTAFSNGQLYVQRRHSRACFRPKERYTGWGPWGWAGPDLALRGGRRGAVGARAQPAP